MLPINIFSELITPISMGLRLFGNIFSGTVVMTLIYYVLGQIWLWSCSCRIYCYTIYYTHFTCNF
ncbi:MAG: F0F1 ATP synthase subunit A [Christensenellales bacterium]